MPALEPCADTPAAKIERWLPTQTQWFMFLLGYFAIHILLRVFISPSLTKDEADQFLATQKWSVGYGPQPPLYTWLLLLLFQIFGASILSLALLKNLCLWGIYVFGYLNGQLLTRSHQCALAASASIFFINEIAWHSQYDRTHATLASLLTSITLFVFLKIIASPRLGMFALFGLCAGLGVISKFNYAFFLVGLLLGGLTHRPVRSVLLDRRMLLGAAILLAIFSPVGIWIITHPYLSTTTAWKFHIQNDENAFTVALQGLGKTIDAFASLFVPLIIVHGLFFGRRSVFQRRSLTPEIAVLLRSTGIMLVLAIVAVLACRVTRIPDRYLIPIFVFVPALSIALFQKQVTTGKVKVILGLAAVLMLSVYVQLFLKVINSEPGNGRESLTLPFEELRPQISACLADVPAVIAEPDLIAGNLRKIMPNKACATPALARIFIPKEKRFAVAWEAGEKRDNEFPDSLASYISAHGLVPAGTVTNYFSAPYKYNRDKNFTLAVFIVEQRD